MQGVTLARARVLECVHRDFSTGWCLSDRCAKQFSRLKIPTKKARAHPLFVLVPRRSDNISMDRFIPTRAGRAHSNLLAEELVKEKKHCDTVSSASPRQRAFNASMGHAMGLPHRGRLLLFDAAAARTRATDTSHVEAVQDVHRWAERQRLPASPTHRMQASNLSTDTRYTLVDWNSTLTFAVGLSNEALVRRVDGEGKPADSAYLVRAPRRPKASVSDAPLGVRRRPCDEFGMG